VELKIAVTQTFNIEALDRHLRAITQLVAGVTVAGPGGPSRAFEAVEVVVVLTEPVDDALQNALSINNRSLRRPLQCRARVSP